MGRPFFRRLTSNSAYRKAVSSVTPRTRIDGLLRNCVKCSAFSAWRFPARNPLCTSRGQLRVSRHSSISTSRQELSGALGNAPGNPACRALHSLGQLPVRWIARRIEANAASNSSDSAFDHVPKNSSKSGLRSGFRSDVRGNRSGALFRLMPSRWRLPARPAEVHQAESPALRVSGACRALERKPRPAYSRASNSCPT